MIRQDSAPCVAVIGTMDTKGAEHAFVSDAIRRHGGRPVVIDTGILGSPRNITVDITAEDVATAAGTTLEAVRATGSRGPAVETMERGLVEVLRDLYDAGQIHGVIALGGAEGTVLGTTAMKALPLGFPKLMVSAVASGQRQFGTYMGASDITIMSSVVDCAGLNYISRGVFANAAAGIMGMAKDFLARQQLSPTKRRVVPITLLGNTQAAFDHLAPRLESLGFEPVPFHANGVGGLAFDALARDGVAEIVIDLTLNEVTNEMVGGVTAAGPDRMTAAGVAGIPQVIVPGCVDFFTFGSIATLPEQYRDHTLYRHNPHFTLVRAGVDDMRRFGAEIAARLNHSRGPLSIVWPGRGLSIEDRIGGEFFDPAADAAFLDSLRSGLNVDFDFVTVDAHINDDAFADAVMKVVSGFEQRVRQGSNVMA